MNPKAISRIMKKLLQVISQQRRKKWNNEEVLNPKEGIKRKKNEQMEYRTNGTNKKQQDDRFKSNYINNHIKCK